MQHGQLYMCPLNYLVIVLFLELEGRLSRPRNASH